MESLDANKSKGRLMPLNGHSNIKDEQEKTFVVNLPGNFIDHRAGCRYPSDVHLGQFPLLFLA